MTTRFAEMGIRLPSWLDETRMPWLQPFLHPTLENDDYHLPAAEVREAPEITKQVIEIARLADMTDRSIADLLGVSHPTVAQLRRGHDGALSRKSQARQRLADAHRVISRIAILARRDARGTHDALTTPRHDGLTALALLRDGRPAEAYLVAAATLRRAPAGTMMVGRHPLDSRSRTVAIDDED